MEEEYDDLIAKQDNDLMLEYELFKKQDVLY
jgi:hypothetical protein